MDTASLDYELPPDAIAQHPASPRDSSRLLVAGPPVEHSTTGRLHELLGPGDVLVLNDTRVMSARLHLQKPTGGAVEVLVLEPGEEGWWDAMVRPSRRVAAGTDLVDPSGRRLLEAFKRIQLVGRRPAVEHRPFTRFTSTMQAIYESPLVGRALAPADQR